MGSSGLKRIEDLDSRVAETSSLIDASPQPTCCLVRALSDFLWNAAAPLFFLIMGIGVWGMLTIDAPLNAPFVWAWRWLAAPVLLIGWGYAFSQRYYFRVARRVPQFSYWVGSIGTPPLMLLMSGGFVNLVNAAFPTGERVSFEGPIMQLEITGGRSKDHCVTLRDDRSGKEVTLVTNSAEYANLAIGQTYHREMEMGLLGFPFRKKRSR
jgi:hypothetical protein